VTDTSRDVDRAIHAGTAGPARDDGAATLERIRLRREQLSQIERVVGCTFVVAVTAVLLGLWSENLVVGVVAGVDAIIAGSWLVLNRHQRRNAEQAERLTRDALHRQGQDGHGR